MKTSITMRRSGGENISCPNDAPRLKPNELRSWMLRSLRSSPGTELPTRADLAEFLTQFDLSESELAELVDGLEQAIGVQS